MSAILAISNVALQEDKEVDLCFDSIYLGTFERDEDESENSVHGEESDLNTETVNECYN